MEYFDAEGKGWNGARRWELKIRRAIATNNLAKAKYVM